MRLGVHDKRNSERDLRGEYALLSSHFYYFGDGAIRITDSLRLIIHNTQGHKSISNQPYLEEFVSWIEGLGYKPNKLYGEPQLKSEFVLNADMQNKCAARDFEDDDDEGE